MLVCIEDLSARSKDFDNAIRFLAAGRPKYLFFQVLSGSEYFHRFWRQDLAVLELFEALVSEDRPRSFYSSLVAVSISMMAHGAVDRRFVERHLGHGCGSRDSLWVHQHPQRSAFGSCD